MRNSNSTQILICVKQFSFLIKAFHSTAWNTSASVTRQACDLYSGSCARVVILVQQPNLLERCGPKRDRWQAQLGKTIVARWQYNFNSGIPASGKTRRAPKPSKTTAAWWLVSNLTDVPLLMKCELNNQFKPDNPQHKPGSPWENWSLPTTSQLHLFCAAWSLFSLDDGSWKLAVSKGDFCAAAFVVEMWAQMDQITNTAWKNTCGTLLVQVQQWHLSEWQD